MRKPKQSQRQADKFREAARKAETDDDEARFDERLKKIAKGETDKKPKPSKAQ